MVHASNNLYPFNIPQTSADDALTKLADQADITVVFDYEAVREYQVSGLRGEFTLYDAVELLLGDTPLGFELEKERHLIVTLEDTLGETKTMKRSTKNNLLTAIFGVFAASGVQPVVAQENESESSPMQMEEILIVARKREESLQDVPVAISVMNDIGLQEAGIDELGDILNNTVGMVYNERDGNRSQAQPGVRGIKSFTGGGVQRISSFIDGMPLAGSQATVQFVDVAGVEVYRGPQSAVFGRSVFAGALNYTFRQPSLDETNGSIGGQFGQDGRQAINGWFTTPLIQDMLGLYVSAATDQYDGPNGIRSTDGFQMGSRDTQHFSGALAFQPTDALSMTLRYTNTELDDGPAPDYNLDPALDDNIQFLDGATAGGAPIYVGELRYLDDPVLSRNFCFNEGEADQDCIPDPGWELERERLAFDVDYEFANGHNLAFKAFTSEDTQFDHDDQDNTAFTAPMTVVNMGTDLDIEEDYQEIVWNSPDDSRLRWTLGYSNYEYTSDQIAWFAHPTATIDGVGRTPSVATSDIKNDGIFAAVFYDVTDDLTVSLEGRRQNDDISANDTNPDDDFVPEAVSTTYLPRIALTYAATDDVSFYAQYAKGVQPATVNAGAVATLQRDIAAAMEGLVVDGQVLESATPFLDGLVAVEEEILDNYEIGMKGTFLDGQLSLNAALFLIETDGYQETQNMFFFPDGVDRNAVLQALEDTGNPDFVGLAATAVRVRGAVNTASIESRGLELEAAYFVSENLELGGQLTYLDAEFDTGCVPIGEAFGINDSALELPGGVGVPCTTVDGNAFPFIPEIQAGASLTYTSEFRNGWEWYTRTDVRYEDEQYMDWFNVGWIPSSTKVNLRAGISNDKFRVEAYIENLTDDRVPLGAQYEPARNEVGAAFPGVVSPPTGTTGVNVAVAYPREAGLKFSYNF